MRRLTISVLIFLVAASAFAGQGGVKKAEKAIPNQYIVVLEDFVTDVPGAATMLATVHRGLVGHVYDKALKGFSVRLSEAQAEELALDPYVASVEEDGVM